MHTDLPLGNEIDLTAAGLVLCAVPEGAGDKELDRLTAGERCGTVAFFENDKTCLLFAAGGQTPLQTVGPITFTTAGKVQLPAEEDWLIGHEPVNVGVGALPRWATDPDSRPPVPKPVPPTPPREKRQAPRPVKTPSTPTRVPTATPCAEIPEYQPFPTEALPSKLRSLVDEVAASVDCDPAFVALPALALVGAAVGRTPAGTSLTPDSPTWSGRTRRWPASAPCTRSSRARRRRS